MNHPTVYTDPSLLLAVTEQRRGSASSSSSSERSTGSTPPTSVASSGGPPSVGALCVPSKSSEYSSASRPSSPDEADIDEPELRRVRGTVFAYGGRVSKLPDLNRPLMEIARQVGTPVLAKSEALDAFARLLNCGHTLVFRRPLTFGLDWFTSMLCAYLDYDWDLEDFIPRLLTPGPRRRNGLHGHYVLRLDLASLGRNPDLGSALMRYCHARCQDFVDRHQAELLMREFPAASNYSTAQSMIAELAMYLKDQAFTEPLFVIVSNFDDPAHSFPTDIAVLTEFLNGLGAYINNRIGGVLLLSEHDDGTVQPCYARNTAADPLIPNLISRVVHLENTFDLTHQAAFQTAVGITEEEINDLDSAFAMSGRQPSVDEQLVDMVRARGRTAVFTAPPGFEVEERWKNKKNPLDALRSFSHLKDVKLSRVCGSVFAFGGRVSKLPDLRGHSLDTFSRVGTPVLAKSESLDAFRRVLCCGYPLILRRPPNYRLDWFIAMLAAHLDYDYDLDDFIPRLIVPGPRQRKGLHDHFILHLDFADLRRHQDLHTELIRYCHEQCQDFLDNNRSRLHLRRFPPADKYPSAHFMVAELGTYLKDRLIGDPLFVLVTNFDECVGGLSDETAVLVEFLNGLGESMNDGIGGVLLVSNKDDGTISQCYTRSAAADALIPQPDAHNIKLENALDLTHHAAFQTAVGVTEQEMNDLDGAFAASGHHPRVDRSLLDLVKAQTRGVVFTAPPSFEVDEQRKGKKNPLDVLQSFSHLKDVKVYNACIVYAILDQKYGPFE
ncbi:hypothetical protein MKEN_00381600 [Mycena kentingensis (nom. inval.)]|nr:hypothetical protein MKEN_00381600 [Mycena kentingensis (nom. inval.)]